jgi:hypothetical protein
MNKLNLTNKTSIAIIIALTLFSTNIYAQIINPNGIGLPACTSCSGTTVSSTKVASTLGIGNEASDTAAFASGYYSEATGHTSTALGYYSIASGDYATAIGNYAEATYNNSFAFGKYVKTSAINTFAFGFGEASQSLNNNVSNSIMFGVGSSTPALTIRRYTGAGRVGIGTTNPQADLDVNGTIKTTGFTFEDGNEGSGKVLSSNSSGEASWADPTTLGIWSLNDDDAWFTSGNVGIGTTSPSSELEVKGTTTLDHDNGNNAGNALILKSGDEQLKIIDVGDNDYGIIGNQTDNTYIKAFDYNDVEGASIFLNTSGNVGIGTPSPSSELEVDGQITTDNFTMTNGAGTGHLLQSNGDGDASWVNPSTLDMCEWSKSGDILYLDESTYDQLGLFTSTPVADFQISDEWTFKGGAQGTNKIIGSNYMYDNGAFRINSGFATAIKFDVNGSLVFNATSSSGQGTPISWQSMAFTHLGNLGIGTTSPSSKLHLYGTSEIDARIQTTGLSNSILWTSNYHNSFGFGIDAAGYGQIYSTISQKNEIMSFTSDGKVLMGGADPALVPTGYTLYVEGKIITEEVKIAVVGSWADYVFLPDYHLPSLNEVESFIAEHGHLPGVPSQEEVKENGIKLAETDATLLKKIEELTLYILQQEKKINQLEEKFEELQVK